MPASEQDDAGAGDVDGSVQTRVSDSIPGIRAAGHASAPQQDDVGAELPPLEEIPGKPLSEMIIEERRAVDELDRLRAENERLRRYVEDQSAWIREQSLPVREENRSLRRRTAELEDALRELLEAVDKLAAYVPPNKWPASVRDRARKLLEEQEK